MPKTKAQPKASKAAAKKVYVTDEVHQDIRLIAAARKENMQELVDKALKVGLSSFKPPGFVGFTSAN